MWSSRSARWKGARGLTSEPISSSEINSLESQGLKSMVNSRGLAEQLAKVWGEPLTEVRQHARNLRESDPPLITAGGRGRHVPDMTADDAASLICATLGSRAVGDSASTVIGLKRLTANYRGSRVKPMDHVAGIVHRFIGSRLDMAKAPDVVQGL